MEEEQQYTASSRKEAIVGDSAVQGEPVSEAEETTGVDEFGNVFEATIVTKTYCSGCGRTIAEDAPMGTCTVCRIPVLCDACSQIRCAFSGHYGAVCPDCRIEMEPEIFYCPSHAKTQVGGKVVAGAFLVAIFLIVIVIAASC